MPSAARAIGWEFRRRLRRGLLPLAGYLAVLWTIKGLILGPGHPIRLDPPNGMAGLVIAPLSVTFFYFFGVFSYGLTGDLSARQSIYPARMFALPVTTAALAGWPMLYGAAAMASLWLATALLAQWLGELDVRLPLIWPALLAAVFLAWTQALTWMPYGLRGLRVIVTVLWLATLDTAVLLAIHFEAREAVMVAILAPLIPLAYVAARIAVARARRGDVPDWRGAFARLAPIADAAPRRRGPFVTPARAQLWFEWRRHGRSLPALVSILLPFELALLFIPGNDTAPVVFATLAAVLLTPPFMAVFAAATISTSNPYVRDAHGVSPFQATRPLTSAALIGAKLKMTTLSTLAAWSLVLVAIPLALILSGTWPVVIERARQGIEIAGTVRAIAIVLLVLLGLLASTWKRLVQGLCIGMTGREWLIKSSVLLALLVLVIIGPVAEGISASPNAQAALWDAVPWIPVGLVCVKMPAAAWIAIRLYDSRLLSDRTLVTGAAWWLVAVIALYGLLAWVVATPLVPRYFLLSIAMLEVPLARVSAAPLALAWNRHR
jgi:hypothetical protein